MNAKLIEILNQYYNNRNEIVWKQLVNEDLKYLLDTENKLRNLIFDYDPKLFDNIPIKYKIYWIDQCLSYIWQDFNNSNSLTQVKELFSHYNIDGITHYLYLKFNVDNQRLNSLIDIYGNFIKQLEVICTEYSKSPDENISANLLLFIGKFFNIKNIDCLLSEVILKDNLGCLGRCFYKISSKDIFLFFNKENFEKTIKFNMIDKHFLPVFFHEIGHKIFWNHYINNRSIFFDLSIVELELHSEIFAFTLEHFLYSEIGSNLFKDQKNTLFQISSFQKKVSKKILFNSMSLISALQGNNLDFIKKNISSIQDEIISDRINAVGSFRDIQYFIAKSLSMSIQEDTINNIISKDWSSVISFICNYE